MCTSWPASRYQRTRVRSGVVDRASLDSQPTGATTPSTYRAGAEGDAHMDTFFVDIEPTNRCNAKCHFCPRDQTPHQGLMAPEVFTQALQRAVEFRGVVRERFGPARDPRETRHRKLRPEDHEVVVNLCGLGEPVLNRATPTFVRQTRDGGV